MHIIIQIQVLKCMQACTHKSQLLKNNRKDWIMQCHESLSSEVNQFTYSMELNRPFVSKVHFCCENSEVKSGNWHFRWRVIWSLFMAHLNLFPLYFKKNQFLREFSLQNFFYCAENQAIAESFIHVILHCNCSPFLVIFNSILCKYAFHVHPWTRSIFHLSFFCIE